MDNEIPAHHVKQEYCETRPKYRCGKRKTAVRVFTVNSESKYLIVSGIPSTGLEKDLVKLFTAYGTILQCKELKDYPAEEFTQVFLIVFKDIQRAKVAKKNLDERYFFGGMLHVCYAPELETLSDTREKITNRRCSVVSRVKNLEKENKQKKMKQDSKRLSKLQSGIKSTEAAHEQNNKPPFLQQHIELPISSNPIKLNVPFMNQSSLVDGNVPCNVLGMPLFLPPPPSSNRQPVFYPSQHDVYDAVGLSSTPPNKVELPSKSETIASKPIEKRVLKKPQFKPKSGYFYEKVLDTLKTKDFKLSSEKAKHDTSSYSGDNSITKSHTSVTTLSTIPSPLFLPRHLELKKLDVINQVETDEDGNILMFGSQIHEKPFAKDK